MTKRTKRSKRAKIEKDPANKDSVQNSQIWNQIIETDKFFSEIIDYIPIDQWGFDQELLDKLREHKHEVTDRMLTKGQRVNLSRADKQKLARQDPEQPQTVTEVLNWIASTSEGKNDSAISIPAPGNSKQGKKNRVELMATATTTEGDSIEKGERSTELNSDGTSKKKEKRKNNRKNKTKDEGGGGSEEKKEILRLTDALAPTRAEALSKLQAKLEDMRKKRKADVADYAEKKRLKRRVSKLALKDRKNKEKAAGRVAKNSENSAGKLVGGEKKKAKKEQTGENGGVVEKKEIRNIEGKLVQSKFDFALSAEARAKMNAMQGETEEAVVEGGKKKRKKNRKEDRNKFQGKDYGRLLQKVEKRQEKLEDLKQKDPEKADRMKKSIEWEAAMQKAEGAKVKDNPAQLKNALKKKEQIKSQKKKKWSQREESVQKRQQNKQERRQKNIKQRKDLKIKNKIAKANKKRNKNEVIL